MELGTELPPLGMASFLLLREEGWLGGTQMEEPGAQGRGTERPEGGGSTGGVDWPGQLRDEGSRVAQTD